MAVLGYDALVHYATPPNSYIGGFIFLSYIVLALYAALSIVYSLYTQYITIFHTPTSPKDDRLQAVKAVRARHIKIYTFLASVSFATLSYHMLFFLIAHYFNRTGARHHNISGISGGQLKTWMLESTLFQDFAQDLVKNAPNAVWTQAAILATWFWNIWMAQKARERNYSTKTMFNFILLSQTLPTGFTVSLFIIQLHLSSADIQPPTSPKSSQNSTQSIPSKPKASLHLPNILLNASLLAQPALQHNQIFGTLLCFERFVLLLPHSGQVSLRDGEVAKCITVSGAFIITSAWMARRELSVGDILAALGSGGFAVKAMGWDAVLGTAVYAVLGWGGGV